MKPANVKVIANCEAPSVKYPGELDKWKEEHIISVPRYTTIEKVVEHCTKWFLSEKWDISNIKGKWTSEDAGIDLSDIIQEYLNN